MRIIQALDNIGVFVESQEEDLDLREYILDSVQFISAIIQIEDEFGIEIPSELLLHDNLASFNSFSKMIEDLSENKTNEADSV